MRFALAIGVAAAIILSAPFTQQLFGRLGAALPGGQFRAIGVAATAVPAAMLLFVAFRRIRERRMARYLTLACGISAAAAYTVLNELSFTEAFHFVEYGVLALLFYWAWCRRNDGSRFVLPIVAGTIAGIVDELFQWFIPLRVGEARDVALNAVALGCGVLFGFALDPPPGTQLSVHRRSWPAVVLWTAAAFVLFGSFVQLAHTGYEITDDEAGTFESRYTRADLVAIGRDRAAQWRVRAPVTLRRMSREDQFLTEGVWHVQERNRLWAADDLFGAWRENLILEKYYAPVLDTPTYLDAAGYRWPPEQRAHAEALAAKDRRPYVSAAYPIPFYTWRSPS